MLARTLNGVLENRVPKPWVEALESGVVVVVTLVVVVVTLAFYTGGVTVVWVLTVECAIKSPQSTRALIMFD